MKIPIVPFHPDTIDSAANVARGAAWLDENFPGWERRVDLSKFDISDPSQCVCGQVVPQEMQEAALESTGYSTVVDPNASSASAYGFAGPRHQDFWVRLIKERFDSGLLSDCV